MIGDNSESLGAYFGMYLFIGVVVYFIVSVVDFIRCGETKIKAMDILLFMIVWPGVIIWVLDQLPTVVIKRKPREK